MPLRYVLCAAAIIVFTLSAAQAVTLDFEDLTTGASYNVGSSFVTSGVSITPEEFFWLPSGSTTGGSVQVQNGGQADGAGNELAVNNVNLNFNFPVLLTGIALQYGEFGGNLNIAINGDFRNFQNFADIHNSSIGGTHVFTLDTGTPGQSNGAIFAVGMINSFKIGGQELWIDNIVGGCIPEPATIAILGLGMMVLLPRRNKR